MTAIMMILDAMKECRDFKWGHVLVMWPVKCDTFIRVV